MCWLLGLHHTFQQKENNLFDNINFIRSGEGYVRHKKMVKFNIPIACLGENRVVLFYYFIIPIQPKICHF
jgi:hypothetical protein